MTIAKDLREKRFAIVTKAQEMLSAADVSAETNATVDAMLNEADTLMSQIERTERADAMAASMAETIGIRAERQHITVAKAEDEIAREKRIITAMLRGGPSHMASADRDVYFDRLRNPQNTALSTGVGSGGGYAIAPAFYPELAVAMKAQGGMRDASTVVVTETGASLPFPTFDDRAQAATIVSENSQITEDTEPSFGQVSLGAYNYKSGFILVSLQLLNDAAFDFDQLITNALASRLVRGQNAHFTAGSGSGQPRGVLTAATLGKTGTTGQTTSVIYNDLVDTMHAVDPVYRVGASWMLHDSSLKVLRKLVDSQNRPLWQPGLIGGAPDTLLGYPIITNQDMPVMAANAKSIAFGNFKSYVIRDVNTSLQLVILRERFADSLQVGFLAWCRSDGNLVSAASPIAYYANSAT